MHLVLWVHRLIDTRRSPEAVDTTSSIFIKNSCIVLRLLFNAIRLTTGLRRVIIDLLFGGFIRTLFLTYAPGLYHLTKYGVRDNDPNFCLSRTIAQRGRFKSPPPRIECVLQIVERWVGWMVPHGLRACSYAVFCSAAFGLWGAFGEVEQLYMRRLFPEMAAFTPAASVFEIALLGRWLQWPTPKMAQETIYLEPKLT